MDIDVLSSLSLMLLKIEWEAVRREVIAVFNGTGFIGTHYTDTDIWLNELNGIRSAWCRSIKMVVGNSVGLYEDGLLMWARICWTDL